jgi:hypothetical protein
MKYAGFAGNGQRILFLCDLCVLCGEISLFLFTAER